MDPLSMTASVIAIWQMTGSLISYLSDVKDSSKESKNLLIEASNLQTLLLNLRFRIEDARNTDPWFQQVRLLNTEGGALDQFRKNLEVLVKKIDASRGKGRLQQALLWKFTREEAKDIRDRIERLKSLISLALANDQFTLSQAIHKEIAQIRLDGEDEAFHKYSSWLKTSDPSTNYNAALKKRQKGTGSWLIGESRFLEWKKNGGKPMWLYGKPGCGKTVLSASVVFDLNSQPKAGSRRVLGFFYFDFADAAKQTPRSLVRSLLLQISSQIPSGKQIIQQLYSSYRNGESEPPDEAVENCLFRVINVTQEAYLVIDALDECSQREALLEFIRSLIETCSKSLHLLLTSRREHDIKEQLLGITNFDVDIQGHHVDHDIQIYVQEKLLTDSNLKQWPDAVKEEIQENLVKKADGMFRWVYCQLDALRKCVTPKQLRKTLASLPITLDETYERILKHIEAEGHLDDAILILQCLCFCRRPLSLPELVEILAIDFDDGFCCEERLPNPEKLTVICSSLITLKKIQLNEEMDRVTWYSEHRDVEVQLGHYSVQEYLLSKRNLFAAQFRPEVGQMRLARACLIYLVDTCTQTASMTEIGLDRPFSIYSAKKWWKHMSAASHDIPPDLLCLSMKLFQMQSLLSWRNVHEVDKFRLMIDNPPDPPSVIYYASLIGLPQIVNELISQGFSVNAPGGGLGSALHAASYGGYKEIVHILLNHGAKIDIKGGYFGSALHAASFKGHEDIVKILLDHGANINAQNEHSFFALHYASVAGHANIVKMLLEHKADVNARDGLGKIALQNASYDGNQQIVQMLVEYGADINNIDEEGEIALHDACYGGHQEVVRILLEHGANVNIRNRRDETTLYRASLEGQQKIVRTLLEYRAHVSSQSENDIGLALYNACDREDHEIAQTLLEYEADINTQQRVGETVLHFAASEGDQKAVQMLLKHGVNVNDQGWEGESALHCAARSGHQEVVQALLAYEVDINARNEDGETALQLATSKGHDKVAQILLDHGAKT